MRRELGPVADSANPAATSYLRMSDHGHRRDWQKQARLVAAAGGPGPWRQLWQILRLRMSRTSHGAEEYYRYGIWKGGIGRANLQGFLAEADRRAYNIALHDPGFESDEVVAREKLKTEARLVAAGLPCVRTRAAVGVAGEVPDHVRRIEGAETLTAFLSDPSSYPMFLKPLTGSFASGTASLVGVEGTEVLFSNGLRAPLAAIVDEMVQEPDGYLIQPPVAAAPELAR